MEPAQFITEYGYLAVFIGTILEGETILVLAGYAAHQGYLALPLVLGTACLGGALGDQMFFLFGRCFGTALLGRFPRMAARAARVDALLLRYQSWVIVGFRFMYGLRVAGPIAMGIGKVAGTRFVLFNSLGAALWALTVGGAGYLFGRTLQLAFDGMKIHEGWAVLALVGLSLLAVSIHALWHRR